MVTVDPVSLRPAPPGPPLAIERLPGTELVPRRSLGYTLRTITPYG